MNSVKDTKKSLTFMAYQMKMALRFSKVTNFIKGIAGIEGKQAGAELGQAQLQLELGFTLIKVCCIVLMITNYLY